MRKGFLHQGQMMTIEEGRYAGGAKALQIYDEEGPYTKLTTNIPGTQLAENEILVKTWSENEPIAASALASGLFRDTGKRVPSGFVEAQVWEIIK